MKKENENEKVQSKVEKTVEHKDKKDVTPEEKLNNIIKKAKEKGKITYGELASELDDANTEPRNPMRAKAAITIGSVTLPQTIVRKG